MKFNISKIMLFSILVLNLIVLFLTKPLTPEVLDYLAKDEQTFREYRAGYKELTCKLLTYSKLKVLYESESIDKVMNQTNNKRGFVDYLHSSMFDLCRRVYSDNNMEIFEPRLYNSWNTEHDKYVAVNLTEAMQNFTILEQSKKDDL